MVQTKKNTLIFQGVLQERLPDTGLGAAVKKSSARDGRHSAWSEAQRLEQEPEPAEPMAGPPENVSGGRGIRLMGAGFSGSLLQ